MVNQVALAGGYIDHHRTSLHGKKVPHSHVCVMLTTARPNIRAPFIAGDVEENFFGEGEIFCPSKDKPCPGSFKDKLNLLFYCAFQ